jgi:hypothetical protein
MTYAEMAVLTKQIWAEVKRRNPLGVNSYIGLRHAAADLDEISEAEAGLFTSECGPKEPKVKRVRKSR